MPLIIAGINVPVNIFPAAFAAGIFYAPAYLLRLIID